MLYLFGLLYVLDDVGGNFYVCVGMDGDFILCLCGVVWLWWNWVYEDDVGCLVVSWDWFEVGCVIECDE